MTQARPPGAGAPPPDGPDGSRIRELAASLGRRLSALRDDALRRSSAAEEFGRLDAASAVLLAGMLLRRARDNRGAASALAALARALEAGLVDDEQVAACRAMARSRGDRLAEALFAQGPARRTYSPDDELCVDRNLQALTLGERTALSRRRDPDWLARLAADTDPRVIRELLRNPRLTERDAVRVAARRPTQAAVLEQVLASRFGLSARVRRAVAQNPYAPLALAARALATLTAQDLRAVAEDPSLSRELRTHAESLLAGRRGLPSVQASAKPPALLTEADRSALAALLRELETEAGDSGEANPVSADSAPRGDGPGRGGS